MENSTVNVRDGNSIRKVHVRIGPDIDPKELDKLTIKWQALIDTTAKVAKVPSALIMRLNSETIEVFVKSNTAGNPYEKGEKAELIYGLYCETVIGNQEKLLVPDARKSDVWKYNNPDIDIDMISYLGYPINWPSGDVFGTVCILDNKENTYSKEVEELLHHVKDHIENDLALLVKTKELAQKNKLLEQLNKTKSVFLSMISHDIRGSISSINEVIKLLLHDFDRYNKTSIKSLLSQIGKRSSHTFQTLEDLLHWSQNDMVDIQPDLENVDLICIVENIL